MCEVRETLLSCALQSGTNCSVSHMLLEVKGFWEKKKKRKGKRRICLFVSFNSLLVWFVLTLERCLCLNLVTEQVNRRNCCVLPRCCTTQCSITRFTWFARNEAMSESKDNSLLIKQLSELWLNLFTFIWANVLKELIPQLKINFIVRLNPWQLQTERSGDGDQSWTAPLTCTCPFFRKTIEVT